MKLGLSVILFLSCVTLFAQGNSETLIKKLNTAHSDSERIVTYRAIFDLFQYTAPDSATYYLKKGLTQFDQEGNKYGIARMLMLLAYIDVNEGRMELAELREHKALESFQELNKQADVANCYNSLGVIEGKNSNYDKATKFFVKALRIFDSLHDIKGLRTSYMKLGVVNERFNSLDKALDYYNKALDLGKKINDPRNDLYLYNDIGIVYGKKGDNNAAIKWFDSALKKCNGPALIGLKTLTLMNLGIVHDHMNNAPKALEDLNEALFLSKETNQPEDYVRINLNIASILAKDNPIKALGSLQEGLKTAKQIGQKSLQIEILDAMIETYKSIKDYKNALSAMETRKTLQDSVYSIDKAKVIANLQSLYDLNKSNERVNILEIAQKRNNEQKNFVIIIALILASSLLTLIYQYRKLRLLNRELSLRGAELTKSNNEKDKLFSIIGHDLRGPIANIPQIIEISNDESTTAEERNFLLGSLKEHSIASLDTLDKLLYWGQMQIKGIGLNSTTIKAQQNLAGVLKLVKNTAEQKNISIKNKVSADIKVKADSTHFDFIMRNLINNAVKFTNNSGTIEIDAREQKEKNDVVFAVKDNGVGMSQQQMEHIFDSLGNSTLGTAKERGTSLGLMLCKEFVEKNGGNIWVESEEGKGSTFFFSLKKS